MDPLRALLEARAAAYRAVQARAGVSFRCLDPEAEDAPDAAVVEEGANGAVTVRIQGPIDDFYGFDYRELISELDEAQPQAIHLMIESPGGYLSAGLALYSDLRARAREGVTVTAEARGVIASAAVLPFLAADERAMATGTELMVHDPWSFLLVGGTADQIEDSARKTIKALRASEKTLRSVLAERTGQSRQQVGAWLKDETWFSPEEAAEAGIATAVIEDTGSVSEADEQAQALARRVMTAWCLQRRRQEAA